MVDTGHDDEGAYRAREGRFQSQRREILELEKGDSRAREGRYIDKTSVWKTNLSGDDTATMLFAAQETPIKVIFRL